MPVSKRPQAQWDLNQRPLGRQSRGLTTEPSRPTMLLSSTVTVLSTCLLWRHFLSVLLICDWPYIAKVVSSLFPLHIYATLDEVYFRYFMHPFNLLFWLSAGRQGFWNALHVLHVYLGLVIMLLIILSRLCSNDYNLPFFWFPNQ